MSKYVTRALIVVYIVKRIYHNLRFRFRYNHFLCSRGVAHACYCPAVILVIGALWVREIVGTIV